MVGTKLVYLYFMRGFLINKNLCFYYWLRKRIGKNRAFKVANRIEKMILMFGRSRWERDHDSL
jgi:hypothetical protein